MKTWQWIVLGIALALVIAVIVCYFCAPHFTFAVSGLLIGALSGFIGGYYVARKYGN